MIEIIVLGGGDSYGESIIIKINKDFVIVIDSFLNPGSGVPYPIEFLRNQNIDLKQSIKLVIATHWHDDHIGGISNILKECINSEFVCSQALSNQEFAILLGYHDLIKSKNSGIKEMSNVFQILDERSGKPILAKQDQILYRGESGNLDFEITSLSPSQESILRSTHEFVQYYKDFDQPINFKKPNLNHFSVVVQLKSINQIFLFGSDLHNVDNHSVGWRSVLGSKALIKGIGSLFKVPHHGSKSSYNFEVWDQVLSPDPIAFVTPWNLGGDYLPKSEDIYNILKHTKKAYITSDPKVKKRKKRNSKIKKKISQFGYYPESLEKPFGALIARLDYSGGVKIGKQGGAIKLEKLMD